MYLNLFLVIFSLKTETHRRTYTKRIYITVYLPVYTLKNNIYTFRVGLTSFDISTQSGTTIVTEDILKVLHLKCDEVSKRSEIVTIYNCKSVMFPELLFVKEVIVFDGKKTIYLQCYKNILKQKYLKYKHKYLKLKKFN